MFRTSSQNQPLDKYKRTQLTDQFLDNARAINPKLDSKTLKYQISELLTYPEEFTPYRLCHITRKLALTDTMTLFKLYPFLTPKGEECGNFLTVSGFRQADAQIAAYSLIKQLQCGDKLKTVKNILYVARLLFPKQEERVKFAQLAFKTNIGEKDSQFGRLFKQPKGELKLNSHASYVRHEKIRHTLK